MLLMIVIDELKSSIMLLVGCSIWEAACAGGGGRRQEVILSCRRRRQSDSRSLLGTRERGSNVKGDSFPECIAMPYAYLVINKSS